MALDDDRPMIVAAIQRGNVEALENLDLGDFKDEFGATAAHYAARFGQQKVLQYLQETSRLVQGGCVTTDGHTPLHDAAATGHRHVAKWLCDEQFCSAKDADADGCTPMHFAARFGKLDVLKYFVTQCGCDPMQVTKSGMTPLHWAAAKGRIGVVKWIIKSHQRAAYERAEDGTTPVYLAAQEGRLKCLAAMADECTGCTRIRATDGTLPIHAAAAFGHYPIVKHLVQNELASSIDLDGKSATPVHYAAANGHSDLLWWLVNNHKLIPDPDPYGSTPLHDAAQQGNAECLGVLANAARLMQNEMSVLNAEDASGMTPLDLADLNEHTACSELLTMRGVQRRKKMAPVQRRKDKANRHGNDSMDNPGVLKSPRLRKANKTGSSSAGGPPPPPSLDGMAAGNSLFGGLQLKKRKPTESLSSQGSSGVGSDASLLQQVKLRKVSEDATSEKSSSPDPSLLLDIRSVDKSQLKQVAPAKRFLATETGRVVSDDDEDDDGSELVVPEMDTDGTPLPVWKKKILEKKVEQKKQKRAVKHQKDSEEKAKWEGIPAWKRKVMEEREAKRLADQQPELARKKLEQEKAAKVAAMPAWKKQLMDKK